MGAASHDVMLRLLKLALVLSLPVGVLAALVVAGRTFGAPGRGHDYVQRIALPPSGGEVGLPRIYGPDDASRPLVVLDAGHGGHDPGAGADALKEKDLTLALVLALRSELLAGGGVRVAMTREDDRYLLLQERSGIARRLGADLFLSIHADSVESGGVRGASVYTLSETGSNEAAARMAERENRADTVNGVRLADASDTVSAILVDLSQREALQGSETFARLLLREAKGQVRLRDETVQSAAFAVLKSPDMPSVLMETGYISDPEDSALLASRPGQQAFARIAAGAIRAYFARQSLR